MALHSGSQSLTGHVRWPSGYVMTRQGDVAPSVFIVVEGAIQQHRLSSRGRLVPTGYLRAPAIVGHEAIAGAESYSTTKAVTSCSGTQIERTQFVSVVCTDREFCRWAFGALSAEIVERHADRFMTAQPIKKRVLDYLVRQATHASLDSGRRSTALTQRAIAELLGCSAEHLNRVLRALEAKGLVRRGRAGIVVASPTPSRVPLLGTSSLPSLPR